MKFTVITTEKGFLKAKEEFPHDEDWDYPVNTNSYVVETIDKSPTIIEAEEGET